MHFPRGLLCLTSQPLSVKSQGEDGALPGKASAATVLASSLAAAASSQPALGLPGHPPALKPGLGLGALPAKEY